MTRAPSVLRTRIYHKRLFPKKNQFSYRLMYLALPLGKLKSFSFWPFFSVNRASIMSFWSRDHGGRRDADLRDWAGQLLEDNGISDANGEVVLITLPRLFGYVFNPVSFWLCYKSSGELRAIIAEVNNTFGETHSYVCASHQGGDIQSEDSFYANKEFHVSPFLERTGYYRFKFDILRSAFISVRIDYFDEKDQLQLQTSIAADYRPLTLSNLFKGWLGSPLMAIKAISLIHWQAIKLFFKSAEYIPKPEQHRWYQTRAMDRTSFLQGEKFPINAEGSMNVFEPH